MELGWSALALLCLAGVAAWFWQDSLAAREQANAAAMEACTRLGLQFLDGTVAFARLSLARELGRLRLRRTYVFDYTADSIERRQGFVVLTGQHIETVGYAQDGRPRASGSSSRLPGATHTLEPPSAGDLPEEQRAQSARVLDLQEWRARHRIAPGGAVPRPEQQAAQNRPEPRHEHGDGEEDRGC